MALQDKSVNTGFAAHICAAALNGPRYNPEQSNSDRKSVSNGIWLCGKCASLVDKNGGAAFPVETLREWKVDAEGLANEALLSGEIAETPSWLNQFATLHYVNLPRLLMMLSKGAISERVTRKLTGGFAEAGYIAQELVDLGSAIAVSNLKAMSIADVVPVSEDLVGHTISFDQKFYTRNGIIRGDPIDENVLSLFDEKKSPFVHTKSGGVKFIFPYNPMWVTTSTAYSDFNRGQGRFAGLALVKWVSDDLSKVIATPLVIGLATRTATSFLDERYE